MFDASALVAPALPAWLRVGPPMTMEKPFQQTADHPCASNSSCEMIRPEADHLHDFNVALWLHSLTTGCFYVCLRLPDVILLLKKTTSRCKLPKIK